ncbi:MAG TPA: hypothetical protein VIW23_11605 [Candidatus Acidoferrum sp.]|jgi:hypothetical protein
MKIRFIMICLFLLATLVDVQFCNAVPRAPQSGGGVSPGDIVETNVNYQPVTGEVLRSYGNLADLNLGQNNVGRYLEVQYMKVVQKAGNGGTSEFGPGDTVRRSNGSIVITGKIMKTNGAYCEIDSSGSGFTGWSKCTQLRLVTKASPQSAAAAVSSAGVPGNTAVVSINSGFPTQSGTPNPAGNHGFYLLKEDVETAIRKGGFRAPAGIPELKAMNTACEKKTPDCNTAVAAIIADSATAVKTNAEGKATLPAVPPGVYYLFGIGQYEGKPLVWNVKVEAKAGANSVTLDQRNGTKIDP